MATFTPLLIPRFAAGALRRRAGVSESLSQDRNPLFELEKRPRKVSRLPLEHSRPHLLVAQPLGDPNYLIPQGTQLVQQNAEHLVVANGRRLELLDLPAQLIDRRGASF
ncbi:MAG: hypothetical protein E6G01_18390 [Actinobacteria bacterium]|nr:MAG: hypothetical protein E6G01_18390 [Actinomycetota bacterium]